MQPQAAACCAPTLGAVAAGAVIYPVELVVAEGLRECRRVVRLFVSCVGINKSVPFSPSYPILGVAPNAHVLLVPELPPARPAEGRVADGAGQRNSRDAITALNRTDLPHPVTAVADLASIGIGPNRHSCRFVEPGRSSTPLTSPYKKGTLRSLSYMVVCSLLPNYSLLGPMSKSAASCGCSAIR